MATTPIDLSAGLQPAPQAPPIDLSAGLQPASSSSGAGQDQGGFFSHLWDNISPGKILTNLGQAISSPKQTYLADESARSADLKNVVQRLKQIYQSNASPMSKVEGTADAAAQGAADFVPFVGTAVNHAADEINQGHTGAGLGDAVGLGASLAVPDVVRAVPSFARAATEVPGAVSKAASNVKNAVTVSPELNAAANAKVPDMPAVPTVAEIQSAALPDLSSRIGKVIDDTASRVQDAQGKPVDTTGINGLSDKAAYAGDAYKQAGQRVYTQLDDLAQKVTGKPWAFQKLASDVNALQEIVDDPTTTTADRADAQARLKDAQANLDQFSQAATDAGIPNVKAAIAQGNKLYSTGLSLEETARGIARNEKIVVNPDGSITRVLKPNNLPLDAAVRQVTDNARPRGHVLAQAVGPDAAQEVQRAVADASQKIAEGKQTARATKAAGQAAQKTAQENINSAQSRVKTIRKRQAAIGAAAGSALVGRALYGHAKSAASALHGE